MWLVMDWPRYMDIVEDKPTVSALYSPKDSAFITTIRKLRYTCALEFYEDNPVIF